MNRGVKIALAGAATSQTASHSSGSSLLWATDEATSATPPINMPPQPGTPVKREA